MIKNKVYTLVLLNVTLVSQHMFGSVWSPKYSSIEITNKYNDKTVTVFFKELIRDQHGFRSNQERSLTIPPQQTRKYESKTDPKGLKHVQDHIFTNFRFMPADSIIEGLFWTNYTGKENWQNIKIPPETTWELWVHPPDKK